MRIVIYRYYHFSFVFFLLLSCLGFKINYLNLSDKSLFGKKLNLEKLSIKLKKYKICPLEIEDLKEIKSIQIVIHDLKNESFNLNKNSIKDLFLDKSVKFFGESNNLKKKIRIALQKDFGEMFINIEGKIRIWTDNVNEKIIYILPLSGVLFQFDNEKIRKIIFPLEFLFFIKSLIIKVILKIKNNLFNKSIIKTKLTTDKKLNINDNYQACFFYHHGRSYGNLYDKDIYFSNNPELYNHKDKMLFIDYTNNLLDKKSNEFNIKDLTNINSSMIFHCLYFFSSLIRHARSLKDIIGVFFLTNTFFKYKKYSNALSKFSNLRVAYFANDITSPKELFLALNDKKISSICHQDRFLISFCNTYPSNISNEYYCISSFIKNVLAKSNNYCPDKIIPVGFWKINKNSSKKTTNILDLEDKNNFSKIVTILGNDTNSNWFLSKVNTYNSWKNQLEFLMNILSLSKIYPKFQFIMRFKSLEWFDIDFFYKIKNEINLRPNIKISNVYDVDNYSFLLCKESDLVLGKYTSLMDECIFSKIPTLIMDYNHQTKNIFSEAFDYDMPDIFCQSFEDLTKKIDLVFRGSKFEINNKKFFLI